MDKRQVRTALNRYVRHQKNHAKPCSRQWSRRGAALEPLPALASILLPERHYRAIVGVPLIRIAPVLRVRHPHNV